MKKMSEFLENEYHNIYAISGKILDKEIKLAFSLGFKKGREYEENKSKVKKNGSYGNNENKNNKNSNKNNSENK